jgi:uncharacterized protein YbjT (DUF2867 family)
MRVAIVGASGMLGAPVGRRLVADGYEVQALARDPSRVPAGAAGSVVQADVTQPATLEPALRGCDALYVSLRGRLDAGSYETHEVQGVRNLVAAARRAGVSRIAYISGCGRSEGNEKHFPVRVKQACEQVLQQGGVDWTILRPTHFMESLPLFVRDGRAAVIGRQPHRYHYLAASDYAASVSRALREPGAANRTFTLLGPQPYTMHEALAVYLRHVAPGMKAGTLPLPLARVIAALTGNAELRFATELFAAFAAMGEEGSSAEADALLGRATTTLEDWCRSRGAAVGSTA